ncbi:MAG: hypothetical protein ACLP07_15120 [Terracidiphilus sp.]
MMENQSDSLPNIPFDSAQTGTGTPTNEVVGNAAKHGTSQTTFSPLSFRAAQAAKKGGTSNSRTGRAKQVTYEFAKPPKGIYVTVHPSPSYHVHSLPVFVNENEGTFHYINPALFESGNLPARFQAACKVMDVHTAALADGTYILWYVFVSASKWRKAAVKAVDAARRAWVIVTSIKARQTYAIEAAVEAIPAPKWESLPAFEQMLLDAFDSSVTVADDKVVNDYMSGGVAATEDGEEYGE